MNLKLIKKEEPIMIRKSLSITIIIISISISLNAHFVHNSSDNAFVCDQCESLTSNEIEIRRYIIEGGGYFLQAGEDLNKFLKMVELSELSNTLDFKTLQKSINSTIDNMEKTKNAYYSLIILTNTTPYNLTVINQVIQFDYARFQENNGLISTIFERVRKYLVIGDVKGIYGEFYNQTSQIIEMLYSIKNQVDAGIFPNISTLWRINHLYIESKLFGQYLAMIFIELQKDKRDE